MKRCLNGHEWVKQRLRRDHVRFESLDNGFLSCADPAALQAACDALGPTDVQAFFDRWSHQLPWPMTSADRAAGYDHRRAICQLEASLTQVFDRPVQGRQFFDHRLLVSASDGGTGGFLLDGQSVAAFYARLMEELTRLGLPVRIWPEPNEVLDPIPFARDEAHRAYDASAVHRYWRILVQIDRVMKELRGRFIGKCSPVHLFWGAMDLAVTRFSGRPAPPHPGGIPHLPDRVTREAYSHEVSSCGFWPGTAPIDYPAFYAYAYPEPPGFKDAAVHPEGAFYSPDFHEFVLPYDRVTTSPSPDDTLLEFLQSSYSAAADLGGWNRAALEHRPI